MAQKNLFSCLVNYSPREGRNPSEDFFTELFAYILNNEPKVLEKFKSLIRCQIKTSYIKTQYTLQKNDKTNQRADILLRDKTSSDIIIIESKIKSEFDADQIKGYLTLITEGKNSKVVSITRDDPEKLNSFLGELDRLGLREKFIHLHWFEVYHILKKIVSNDMISRENRFVINETIKFMEDENMAEFEGFEDSDLGVWTNFNRFSDKVDNYLEQLRLVLEKEGYKFKRGNSEKDMFKGYWIPSFKNVKFDESVWVGFWNLDIKNEKNFRVYCCVQLVTKNMDFDKFIIKKYDNFLSDDKLFSGVMCFKSLISVIGDCTKDQQAEKINSFFKGELKILEDKEMVNYINKRG